MSTFNKHFTLSCRHSSSAPFRTLKSSQYSTPKWSLPVAAETIKTRRYLLKHASKGTIREKTFNGIGKYISLGNYVYILKRNNPHNAEVYHCKLGEIIAQFFVVHGAKFVKPYDSFLFKIYTKIAKRICVLLKVVIQNVCLGGYLTDTRDTFSCLHVWSGWPPIVIHSMGDNALISGLEKGRILTKAYDVTIQRHRNSHAKIQDSKMHILRCMGSKFCVKFQGALWNFTQSFEPIHRKILRGGKNLTTYAILELWHLKS